MPEQLLERVDLPEVELEPFPPDGLDTALYEHDERASRADLRRQLAAMELELGRLVASAFPRQGLDFRVPGAGGPRLLSVDELERLRDALATRIQEVKHCLDDQVYVERRKRELIDRMVADPAAHKWVRISNGEIGEPGCKHWHSRPAWGPIGMLLGWWRVKISSGCPLAKGPRPRRSFNADEATAPQAASAAYRVREGRIGPIRAAGRERDRVRRTGLSS